MARQTGKFTKTCPCCNRRKVHDSALMCTPCRILTEAEGTRAQYGSKSFNTMRKDQVHRVKKYNRLIAAGKTTTEIAPVMGFKGTKSLLNWASMMRSKGHIVDSATFRTPTLPPVVIPEGKKQHNRVNHGEGAVGVHNCKCLKCRVRKRDYQREYRAAAGPPASRAVPHGGGVTGKRGCKCDLCLPLKQTYMKRYRETYRKDTPP